MNLKYKLYKNDFLELQLYSSSTSKNSQRTRKKSRLIVPLLYLIIGVLLILSGKNILGFVILILGLIWFLFYPLYSKNRYKKHFEKHIDENYSQSVNKEVEVRFSSDLIELKDLTSESKVKISEISKLIELKDHFFLKLNSHHTLIIPKRAITDFKIFTKMISEYKIDYLNQLEWKWK